jgi:rubrerythrin
MDIRKIYEYALQREIDGKRFFEENANRLSHAAAIGTFKTLATEEQKHIEFIQHQLKSLATGQASSTEIGLAMQQAGFFSQRATSEMLDQTISEAMVPDLPILRMAYLIERDFAEFYESYAHQVEGSAQDVLLLLASWEHTHERLFKYMHEKAFEQYAEMPWGG